MGHDVPLLPLTISLLGIAGIVVWHLQGRSRPTVRLIVQIAFFAAMTAVLGYARASPIRYDPSSLDGASALLLLAKVLWWTHLAWALIGFEGLRDYPKLLRTVQDVYAERSLSVSTVAGALGASVSVAVVLAAVAGVALLVVAALVARRPDGDRRAFALAVGACILASPIVWPNYAALLFVPIAIMWPRLSPAWFFGYVWWLLGAISPKPSVSDVCCRPVDVPEQAWAWSHTEPVLWFALGTTLVVIAVTVLLARAGAKPRKPIHGLRSSPADAPR